VLLGTPVVSFVGLEWWARGVEPQLPQWHAGVHASVIMQGHPTRLWGMTPGIKLNGDEKAKINKLGLRGETPDVPRPTGRQRILLLGDSAFFGHGVADSQTPAAQLEDQLRDRGLDVDVVNAAVAGYSIAQSSLLMEEIGWDLEPTLVLYANLWSDNTWDAFEDEDLLASRRAAQLNPLVHSAALKVLAAWLTPVLDRDGGQVIVWTEEDGWPTDRVRRVPIRRYAELTDALIREGTERGAGALLIKPSNTVLLGADGPDFGLWDPYFDALDLLGDCHGVPVVDLTEKFSSSELPPDDVFMDLMHPTPAGQGLVAEAIGEALIASGWPDSPLLASGGPCDVSSLKDRPAPGGFNDRGVGSPQANLFLMDGRPVAASGQDFQGEKEQHHPPPTQPPDPSRQTAP